MKKIETSVNSFDKLSEVLPWTENLPAKEL